jgi:hypothetical protein
LALKRNSSATTRLASMAGMGVVGDGMSVMVEGHGRGPPSVSTHPVPGAARAQTENQRATAAGALGK